MLILTRRPGETVVIQGDIKVHVLAVEGERVKLGVDAPRHVPIVREELLEEVRQSNLEAAVRPDDSRRLAASLGRLVQRDTS